MTTVSSMCALSVCLSVCVLASVCMKSYELEGKVSLFLKYNKNCKNFNMEYLYCLIAYVDYGTANVKVSKHYIFRVCVEKHPENILNHEYFLPHNFSYNYAALVVILSLSCVLYPSSNIRWLFI